MTCQHCCDAEKIFNDKQARKHLKRYRRKGPWKTTRKLISQLRSELKGEKSVLDIGAGIGAVYLDLLDNGIEKATHVDASGPYIEMSKELAKSKKHVDKVSYHHGDFLGKSGELDNHDIVVLDKVLCCYPHMSELLKQSMLKSNALIALVYPKSSLVGKLVIKSGNIFLWLKKSSFRAYMHSNDDIKRILKEAGFENQNHSAVFPWNIEVYRRVEKREL